MTNELIEAFERELYRYTNLKKVSVIHIKLYGVDMMDSERELNLEAIEHYDHQIEWLKDQLEGLNEDE